MLLFIIQFFITIIILILYLFINHSGLFINFKYRINRNLNLLKEIEFLNEIECKNIYRKVMELRYKWEKRDCFGVLYTLGKGTYLNDKFSKLNNDLLKKNYSNTYVKLLQKLKVYLGENVVYKKNANLPGFHIFTSKSIFKYPIASFHRDLQYNSLEWNKKCDNTKIISFTIPINLPKNESGLYIFNYTGNNLIKAMYSDKKKYKYTLGKIYIHNGMNWHIISPTLIDKHEYRITIQGHGMKCGNTWYIYW